MHIFCAIGRYIYFVDLINIIKSDINTTSLPWMRESFEGSISRQPTSDPHTQEMWKNPTNAVRGQPLQKLPTVTFRPCIAHQECWPSVFFFRFRKASMFNVIVKRKWSILCNFSSSDNVLTTFLYWKYIKECLLSQTGCFFNWHPPKILSTSWYLNSDTVYFAV